ncbi:hypothetical protein [Luteimicrobium sp. DT211]|uniref:hypothetical protein n=1 Tax=Luteimicrobium sp. DT211 TaxID=3393412 RepID=UPI003CFB0090
MAIDDYSERPRRRVPRWVWATIAGALVVGAGAVALAMGLGGSSTPPASAGPSAASSPATSTSTAPDAVGGLRVAAGSGGTKGKVASDGRTPLGYANTCEGAVQAATNYVKGIEDGLYQPRLDAKGFAAYVSQLTDGLDGGAADGPVATLTAEFTSGRAEVKKYGTPLDPNASFHPEWGAFIVRSCVPGTQASVDVVAYETPYMGKGNVGVGEYHVTLAWFENDWHLAGYEAQLDGLPDGVSGVTTSPVPADHRHAWIAAAGPGWTEYTNAPQG